jgi:ubiquinone/menaquinone biosynthesis C-methylase UbiE
MSVKGGGEAIHGLGTESKAIEEYYTEWGPEKYEANLREWGYTAPTVVTKMVAEKCGAPIESARVLDAGCGSGFAIADFQAVGFPGTNVSAIDIWQGGLDQAASRGYYGSLTKVDLQAAPYPFEDGTFDAVMSVGVLTYLQPESACLSELIRVAKSGGIVCYSNRTDKMELWAGAEKALEDSGKWALVERSERLPYLPNNAEFNTETEIIVSTWRKL